MVSPVNPTGTPLPKAVALEVGGRRSLPEVWYRGIVVSRLDIILSRVILLLYIRVVFIYLLIIIYELVLSTEYVSMHTS